MSQPNNSSGIVSVSLQMVESKPNGFFQKSAELRKRQMLWNTRIFLGSGLCVWDGYWRMSGLASPEPLRTIMSVPCTVVAQVS